MTREPRCSAFVKVKLRGQFRCPFAGTRRIGDACYCEPHYRAARLAAKASDQPTHEAPTA